MLQLGVLVYNGLNSSDYGIVIEHPPEFPMPEVECDKVHVPGRNGDVIVSSGEYKNVTGSYDIAFGSYTKWYPEMVYQVSRWLHSAGGSYARLEDSYDPDHYRMAAYLQGTEFSNIMMRAGEATIEFECKPQRFLKVGDDPVYFDKSNSVSNPTQHPALPLIKIMGKGKGTLQVGDRLITISTITDGMIIDSDVQDVYAGNVNKNPDVTMLSGFPILNPGVVEITFSGGITGIEITPRWWTL